MTVTNPLTTARKQLFNLLRTEFAADGFIVLEDRLHKSLGRDGKTRIGVSPLRERPLRQNIEVLQYQLHVQFYGKWKDEINPAEITDPTIIETYAERFKRALRTGDPDQDTVWYFILEAIDYPDDPTGNATRFEAEVTAMGTNSALLETTG